MDRTIRLLRPLMLLALLWLAGPGRAGDDCRALRDQRDQLARRAMAAEIALLHAVRRRLCPVQESQASAAVATGSAAAAPADFDFAGYIRCREQAEVELRRSRAVLHRQRLGFPYYSVDGARLARQAEALDLQQRQQCPKAVP